MYLGVDIGGTKTLVASLNDEGVIQEQFRFSTPQNYGEFLSDLKENIDKLVSRDFLATTVAVPATQIDRVHDVEISFGNLSWENVNLKADVSKLVSCPVLVENDAKLAGLSEAMLVKDQYSKVLYLTISTGIGYALINNGKIDIGLSDGGGRTMPLKHDNEIVIWEDITSGRAIVKTFGKMAKDINDSASWQKISSNIAEGLIQIISITQPDVVIIGGGVGTHFDKFGDLLIDELDKYAIPKLVIPPVKGAERADEAVIFGCYDLAKQI